ncbi:hypothetical protein EDB81DRAFT_662501 [Dactylonectria macrodidyma]|uniref:Zn(2)-C6 fungal-type domain-containing protein n=1 Tax=Dactylonectria macrodidyma TaxID=307937 RepID=A0A9P9DVJ7_9HYPO|nr:hypothetical protein EDB81DRAFT_662501 [Dactylonectria macrodidyma]
MEYSAEGLNLAANDLLRPSKGTRTRSAQACLSCRSRKVRCDVSRFGNPCGNCTPDDKPCVVTGRAKRGRVKYAFIFVLPDGTLLTKCRIRENSTKNQSPSTCPSDSNDAGVSAEPKTLRIIYMKTASNHPPTDILTPILSPDDVDYSVEPGAGLATTISHVYYPFLTTNNVSRCLPQDFNFLELQGCFHVPIRLILDELVHQYFSHVHPHLPLLDETESWQCYHPDSTDNGLRLKLPLLLFRAMLFSASNFVSIDTISLLGYTSIRATRASFYRKSKLLYDFNIENSPVAIAQAAILLSFWTPPLNEMDDMPNTRWLRIAVEYARRADAHVYSAMETPKQIEHKSIRRLWWCCIMRDRILALGLRRSILLSRADFHFEKHLNRVYSDMKEEIFRSQVHSQKVRQDLAKITCKTFELCVALTDVLLLVSPLNGEVLKIDNRVYTKYKNKLHEWLTSSGVSKYTRMSNCHDHCIFVLANLMIMHYNSAMLALCHYALRINTSSAAPCSNVSFNLHKLGDEIEQATFGMTECLNKLNKRRLTRWLPITAVAYSAFPLALYVLDVGLYSRGQYGSSMKMQRLGILMDSMKLYRPQYHGVPWIAKIICDIFQHFGPLWYKDSLNDWKELLILHPSRYIQLSMALDRCLRGGRRPSTEDFQQLHQDCLLDLEFVPQHFGSDNRVENSLLSSPLLGLIDAMSELPCLPMITGNLETAEEASGYEGVEPRDSMEEVADATLDFHDDDNHQAESTHIAPSNKIQVTSLLDIEENMELFIEKWQEDLLA